MSSQPNVSVAVKPPVATKSVATVTNPVVSPPAVTAPSVGATNGTTLMDTIHSVPEVELAPEFEGAIELALKNFGDTWDLSKQPELLNCLVDNLRLAFSQIKMPSTAGKKTRGTSGYNEYIKSRWEAVREAKKKAKQTGGAGEAGAAAGAAGDPSVTHENETPQETMSDFAKDWQSLPDTEKEKFHAMAKQKNSVDFPNKGQKARRKKGPMSGYNYFIKLKTSEIKDTLPNMPSTDRMTYISGLWSGLTEADKDNYKKKASDEFWAENPDLLAEREREEAERVAKAQEKARQDAEALSGIRQPVVAPPKI